MIYSFELKRLKAYEGMPLNNKYINTSIPSISKTQVCLTTRPISETCPERHRAVFIADFYWKGD